MADLAGVSALAAQEFAAADHARTDPDLAVEVDQVLAAAADAAAVLGERAEVGLVRDQHRDVQAEPVGERAGEVEVPPAHVGGEPDQPVGVADDAAHRHGDADAGPAGRCVRQHLFRELGQDGSDLGRIGRVPVGPRALAPAQEHAAEPDQGRRQPFHPQVHREDVHTGGLRLDDQ